MKKRTWSSWVRFSFGIAFGGGLLSLGVAGLAAWAIMGRVCTDAKAAEAPKTPRPAFFDGLPAVLNIAHRGASKLAPEHSLAAYALALAQGADVLELDLRLTRDGALVVAHDRTLERTLGVASAVAELTLAELENIAGARAPLRLEQVFDQFADARFNLELKDDNLAAAHALARLLRERGVSRRVLVASAHRQVLAELRAASAGEVTTSASTREALEYYFCQLMERTCPAPYSALQLPPLGWLGVTSAAFVHRAHERGLMVHYWTVDDPAQMRQLLDAGADGIMTNRPDVLEPLLQRGP
jgi:glycerophosphoryl diester phosphodiesterase